MPRIDGIALGAVAAGSLFMYAGITGKSVPHALQALVQGKSPQTVAPTQQITTASAPVSSAGGGLGTAAGSPVTGSGSVSPLQVYKALRHAGVPRSAAIMLTAIAGVESGYNTTAWNQTAATGDNSVGLFQINYFDGLYAERVALTGMTPEQMHAAGVQEQASAAAKLYAQSGLQPWGPDISSGKVNQFLGGANAAAGAAGI